MDNSTLVEKGILEQAGDLVSALEGGDQAQAMQIVDDMTRLREKELFKEIGRMTRQLHDALIGLNMDSSIVNMTVNQIPDAKECLGNVVGMTENAAHHTLTLVGNITPICDDIDMQVAALKERCVELEKGNLTDEEVRSLAGDLGEFFTLHKKRSTEVGDGLREILIAQEYQDLTGQMIKRTIDMVHQIENGLVEMLRASGTIIRPAKRKQEEVKLESITSQDGVDDLLSSMGF